MVWKPDARLVDKGGRPLASTRPLLGIDRGIYAHADLLVFNVGPWL
jgi:hypothetical protein